MYHQFILIKIINEITIARYNRAHQDSKLINQVTHSLLQSSQYDYTTAEGTEQIKG